MLILGLRIVVPLCEHSKEYWSSFCICCSRREIHLDNISTWWHFRYQIRRSHTDGAGHLLPICALLHSRCVSIKILMICVQRLSLFPASETDKTHNTSHFLPAFWKPWWGVLMWNVQAVGFRTWDFRPSFLTSNWDQWLFFSPTVFSSLCWKTKYILYYIYHVRAGRKMLLLK